MIDVVFLYKAASRRKDVHFFVDSGGPCGQRWYEHIPVKKILI